MDDELRTMFLFGPEDVPEHFGALRCVVSIKKYSWKDRHSGFCLARLGPTRTGPGARTFTKMLEMLRARVESSTFAEHE